MDKEDLPKDAQCENPQCRRPAHFQVTCIADQASVLLCAKCMTTFEYFPALWPRRPSPTGGAAISNAPKIVSTPLIKPETANTAENSTWMTRAEAAALLKVSYDTIDRARVPWTDTPPPEGKIRSRQILGCPRLWREDVENNSFTDAPVSPPSVPRLRKRRLCA